MAKRVSFPTRSFGSDAQEPDHDALAEWVGARRGRAADLVTYQLEAGLVPQIEARVIMPCAGGRFYQGRLLDSLFGIEATAITGEVGCDTLPFVQDALDLDIIEKNVWFAAPSPKELGLTDRYFHDRDEAAHSVYSAYQEMMRAMRDAGIGGHVLLCRDPSGAELEVLAGRKVFFFCHDQTRKSLALLLEYQAVVAIKPSSLGLIQDLMGEYDVQKIVLLDAQNEDLVRALELKDPDCLFCGGYCQNSCSQYWKSIVEKASVVR